MSDVIQELIDEYSKKQFIGARYVPKFMGEWDAETDYEPLCYVMNQGNSYVSKKPVPAGTSLNNEEYWFVSGIFNSQLELYRQQVRLFGDLIENNTRAIEQEIEDREDAITDVEGLLEDEKDAREIADAELQDAIDNCFTKEESDARYKPRTALTDDILVCIGDSILAGWSDEYPSNVPAWDTYLASALGFTAANTYKVCAGGAGFACGTPFKDMLATARDAIVSAGKDPNDVTFVVVGGGVNDVRNNVSEGNMQSGVANFISNAATIFPNAVIHIFPMVIGNTGVSDKLLLLESYAQAACSAASAIKNVVFHNGVWSWNYDGNDSGVSADRIHLLPDGQKRVGTSMALEINGGSAYRGSWCFPVTDINGDIISWGRRVGDSVTFALALNITSTGASNLALGVDFRYGQRYGCISFTDDEEATSHLFFYSVEEATWNSYQALSADGCYGTVFYRIESPV